MTNGFSLVVTIGRLEDCERFTWGPDDRTAYRGSLRCGKARIPVVSYREPLTDGFCVITGRLASYNGRVQVIASRVERLDFADVPQSTDADEWPPF